MNYFKKKVSLKSLILVVSLMMILMASVSGTFAYIITNTPSYINTFLSGFDPSGDLIISKEVTHSFGEGYVLPEGLSFDFTVSLGEDYVNKTVETSVGEKTADNQGNIYLSVQPDESVTIKDILEDTHVNVQEQETLGFTPKEGYTQSLMIERGDNHVLYTNDYKAQPVINKNIHVNGTKLLEGRDWQEGDSFEFLLEYKYASDETEMKSAGTTSVVYDANNPAFHKFSFTEAINNIVFDKAGTYSFRISEKAGTIGGIVYDKVVSYFDIVVTDKDMDGYLEINEVKGYQNAKSSYDETNNIHNVDVVIKNEYFTEGTAAAEININKYVESHSGEEKLSSGYTFELYDDNGLLVATSDQTSALGKTSIELVYETQHVGETFNYVLKETHSGKTINGMKYDDTAYNISVSVIDNLDGTISASITTPDLDQLESNICNVEFINIYDPADASATISGNKVLNGRELKENEFKFDLYETEESFVLNEEIKPVETVTHSNDGKFSFTTINYNQVGTFRYVIKENCTDKLKGVTYDDSEYYVLVNVTDENGILKADMSIRDQSGKDSDIQFINNYVTTPVAIRFNGTKVLKGMDLDAAMFTFNLYNADEQYNIKEELYITYNDENGHFSFDNIIFDQPGTYYYVLKEDCSKPIRDIEYDKSVYNIRVDITDNGLGELTAEYTITDNKGKSVEDIQFVNTYTKAVKPEKPDGPNTSDNTPVLLYGSLMTISLGIILVLKYTKRED